MHCITQSHDVSVKHLEKNTLGISTNTTSDKGLEGLVVQREARAGFMRSIKAFLDAHNVVVELWVCIFFVDFGTNTAGGRVEVPNCSYPAKWDTLDAAVEPNQGTIYPLAWPRCH
jgi:hypothetical protein